MELEKYIFTKILRWPKLYKFKTFEKSRLFVLDHIFLVIGNGMEWTKDNQGSFITDTDNRGKPYIPILDQELPKDYFNNSDEVNEYEIAPYPISEYSAIFEMLVGQTNSPHIKNFKLNKIKKDWITGALDIASYSLSFYKDSTKDRFHIYSPEKTLFFWNEQWKEAEEKNRLTKIKKDLNVPDNISTPLEAATFSWNLFKHKQILILEEFIQKFK